VLVTGFAEGYENVRSFYLSPLPDLDPIRRILDSVRLRSRL
jgi:hypothetical protein